MQQNTVKIYNASAGSGKTFTLVKEYLKVLLSSSDPYKFQQILALTFTNKATAEMKERIIENLRTFSENEDSAMFSVIQQELRLPKNTLAERSKKVLQAILQRYAAFKVTTIDSFNHQIIRAFSYDLGISLTADIELDAKKLLDEAVDLLVEDIGSYPELTETLVKYAISKLHQDKSWDVSLTLKNRAAIILNENDAAYIQKIKQLPLSELRKTVVLLINKNKEVEKDFMQIGSEALALIASKQLNQNDFSYGDLPKFFVKLSNFPNIKFDDLNFEGRLHKNITTGADLYPKRLDEDDIESIKQIEPQLKAYYHQAHQCYLEIYETYLLNKLVIENLLPLAMMQQVNKYLQKIKKEQNLILNAEFNSIIQKSINNQPAPFIYERIGERFSHFFIDEMQDTSQLQWKNLQPLVENSLTQEAADGQQNFLLMVGDAKQSIYRWRGGNAAQFINLSNAEKKLFNLSKEVEHLDTNYRSFSEIIHFNNHFFSYLSTFFGNKDYEKLFLEGNNQQVNHRQGGYVQLQFVEKSETKEDQELRIPEEVFKTIQNLDKNYQKSDVCILVRTRKIGVDIANYLNEQGIEVISSETLLIDNNPKVQFILNVLKSIHNPLDLNSKIQMLYFLHDHLSVNQPQHDFYQQMLANKAVRFFQDLKNYGVEFSPAEFLEKQLFDGLTYLIHSFQLMKDQADAYVQFFLDEVIDFTRNQSATAHEFLEHWEKKKHELSIVSSENEHAVRIMTIHKAKGLEFPVVIYPYNTQIYKQIDPTIWCQTDKIPNSEHVLLPFGKHLNYLGAQGVQLFNERREELELDNFNVLYVALTRAVEQLYVITDAINLKKLKEYNSVAAVFAKYLEERGLWSETQSAYSFGNSKRPIIVNATQKTNFKKQNLFTNNLNKQLMASLVSREAMLWESEQEKAIDFGNLIHQIMLKINTKNDVKKVLDATLYNGKINESAYEKLKKMIDTLVNHPQISMLFEARATVLNERKLINHQQELEIPDRVVFVGGIAHIIDYKTGKHQQSHENQVNQYASSIAQMGHSIGMKVLVYLHEGVEVKII